MSKAGLFKVVGIAVLLIGIVLAVGACGGGEDSIVGTWASDDGAETVTINDDGTMSVDDGSTTYEFTYEDKDGGLVLSMAGIEAGTIQYKLDGDTLTLTADGEDTVYKRK